MFRIINNIDDSSTLSIEAKGVLLSGNNYSFIQLYSSSIYPFFSINNNTTMFIKIKVENISSRQFFKDATIYFDELFTNYPLGTILRVYKLNAHIDELGNNPSALMGYFTESLDYLIDERIVQDNDTREIKLDFSEIFDDYFQNVTSYVEFVFAVKLTFSTSPYSASIINFPSFRSTNLSAFNFDGLNPFNETQKHSCSKYDVGYINLKTGTMTHVFNLFTSRGKKVPISIPFTYNYLNNLKYFNFRLSFDFEYQLTKKDENSYVLKTSSSYEMLFEKVDRTASDIDSILLYYGILHADSYPTELLFYCEENASYMYVDINENDIYFFDKDDKQMVFERTNNEYRLIKRGEMNGDYIEYHYIQGINENKISSITNTDGDIVNFIYTNNGVLSQITFVNEKRIIAFDQTNDGYDVSLLVVDDSLNLSLINKLSLHFDQDNCLSNIFEYDSSNNQMNKLTYVKYSQNKISQIYRYITNTTMVNRYSYQYNSSYTKITFFDSDSIYYYFDRYGRTRLVIDDKGNVKGNNFQDITSGKINTLSESRKPLNLTRNIVENHSFEYFNNNGNLLSWSKTGSCTKFELSSESVFGAKCLYIETGQNETITLSQTLVNIPSGIYRFSIFAKKVDSASISASLSLAGNPSIDFTDLGEAWDEYSCGDITVSSTVASAVLNIIIGPNSKVYIDELTFSTGDQNIRYSLIKNGYLEKLDSSTNLPQNLSISNDNGNSSMILISSADSHLSFLGNNVLNIARSLPSISNSQFINKTVYLSNEISGFKGEQINLSILLKCYATKSDTLEATLVFCYKNIGNLTYHFDFDKDIKDLQFLSRAIIAEDDYSHFDIYILYNGLHQFDLYAIEAYRDSNSVFVDYDRRGGIALFTNSSGATYSLIKNAKGQNQTIENLDGGFVQLSYNSNGDLTEVDDLNGNKVSYQYDLNNNVNQLSLIHGNNSEIISTQYVYNVNSTLCQVIEENAVILEYDYDYLHQIEYVTHSSGMYEYLLYDNLGNLQSIEAFDSDFNSLAKNEITFDYQLDTKASFSGSGINSFSYTHDAYGRVLSYSCYYLSQWQSYTYNSFSNSQGRGLPSSKSYRNNKYFFIYDDKNRVTQINFGTDENNSTINEYHYNEHSQVAILNDVENDEKKYFSYDLKGRLFKYITQNVSAKYKYDKLDNVQEALYNFEQNKKIVTTDYYYENNTNSKESFIKLLTNNGDEVVFAPNNGFGESGAVYSYNNCELVNDNTFGFKIFRFFDEDDAICYDLSTLNQSRNSGQNNGRYFNLLEWKSTFKNQKTIYLFVKYDGALAQNKTINLIKLYSQNDSAFVSLDINCYEELQLNSNLYLSYPCPDSSLQPNVWNLIAISIYVDNSNTTRVLVALNNEISNEFTLTISGQSLTHAVFYRNMAIDVNSIFGSSETHPIPLDMHFSTPLIGFSNKIINAKMVSQLISGFNSTFFQNDNSLKINSKSVFDDTFFGNDSCDYLPLNGSFDSKNGLKPIHKSLSEFSLCPEENEIFIHESTLKKRVLNRLSSVFLNPLSYSYGFTNKGTISLWFNLNSGTFTNKRYIFLIHDNQNSSLGLFINSNYLYLDISGSFINLNSSISTDSWHHLYFAFGSSVPSGAEIRIDGNLIALNNAINAPTFISPSITLGSKHLGDLNNNYSCLDGKLDSTLLFKDYVAYTNDFKNHSRSTAFVLSYDYFDRLSSKEILTSNLTHFKNEYSYNRFKPTSETLFSKNGGTPLESFSYLYDDKGNVTKIYSGNQLLEKYIYDDLNRLIGHIHGLGEYDESFSYDSNGNITRYVRQIDGIRDVLYTYTYNHTVGTITVKNQNNVTVFSSQFKAPYPTPVVLNGVTKTFTWKGKRLTKIGNNITYTYNEEGIRTRKVTSNEDTSFILEGKKILRMVKNITNNPNPVIFDFNYDINNQLVSLSYNNQEYFYVRNVLGDILGMINSNGDYVVKYSYTAFGVPIITILGNNDDAIVGTYNPYLFKGYYYDLETGFYYLNSRYYYPVIARFISGDDPSYLDETKFNGLNIYSYCNNNPVMYVDPNGNSIIAILFLSAIAGMMLNMSFQLIKDVNEYSKTGNWDHFNGWNYFTSGIGGFVGGFIGGIAIGTGAQLLASSLIAFAGGFSSTFVEMITENVVGLSDYSFGDVLYNSISNGMFSYIFAFGSSAIVDCCPSIGSFGETTKGIANVVRESSRRTQGYIANCVKYYINLRIVSTTEETINAIIKSILMVLDV